MKKKFLSMMVLVTIVTGAWASNEIVICGVTITDELAAQGNLAPMLNEKEDVKARGSITFNVASQTLVFDNAEIVYTPQSEGQVMRFASWTQDFTILLKGTNKLTNAYTGYADAISIPGVSSINITITGEGSLVVSSLNWYAIALLGGKLTLDDTTAKFNGDIAYNSGVGGALYIKKSNVTATAIHSLSAIELTDCNIVQPEGAFIESEEWNEQVSYSINKNGSSADIVISNGSSNIEGVNSESITDKRFYTIDGMTLQDKPTHKGVYIVNGTKVVMK